MKLKIVYENGDIFYLSVNEFLANKDGNFEYKDTALGTVLQTIKNYTRIELDGEVIYSQHSSDV